MLSVQECRELIDDSENLSNDEIEKIKRDLYDMAELALELYFKKKKPSSQTN